MNCKPMLLEDLIEQAKEALATHGNVPVVISVGFFDGPYGSINTTRSGQPTDPGEVCFHHAVQGRKGTEVFLLTADSY